MQKYIFIQKRDGLEFVAIIPVIKDQIIGDSRKLYIESKPMTEEEARIFFDVTPKFNELMKEAKDEDF